MVPVSAALVLILVSVISTAIWLARNQIRVRTTTRAVRDAARRWLDVHLDGARERGICSAARLSGGTAAVALAVGVTDLCGLPRGPRVHAVPPSDWDSTACQRFGIMP